MPVAIELIVDQGHIQDVIRALANSRLRFQNTQIQYERFRGTISLGEPGPVAGEVPPGDPAALIGRRGSSRPRPRGRIESGPGGRRGGGPIFGPGRGPGGRQRGPRPIPGENPAGGEDEEDNNLVELTVYGLISLYEQYPPRVATGQAAAPGSPAAPASVPTPNAPPPPPPPAGAPIPPPAGPAGNLPPAAPAGPNPTASPPPKPSGS